MARKLKKVEPAVEEKPAVVWTVIDDIHTATLNGRAIAIINAQRGVAKVNLIGSGDWINFGSVAEAKLWVGA